MFKRVDKVAPVAAMVSSLASLACCMPWGIAAIFGSLGIGMSLERHRPWLIALSIALLAWAAYSLARNARSCHRLQTGPTLFVLFSAIVVFITAVFPDTVMRLFFER